MLLRHVGIVVDDLEKMKQFYINTFGFEILCEEEENPEWIKTLTGMNTKLTTCKLIKDGFVLELLKYADGYWRGRNHIALNWNNLGNVNPEGTCKVEIMTDLEGNQVELVQEI